MSSLITDLEPWTQTKCHELLARWEAAMHPPFRVTHTRRTLDEQLHLWMQGRKLVNGIWGVIEPRLVVTKAKPGESPHNYGAAFDICFVGPDPYLHAYEVEHHKPDPLWQVIGQLGTDLGLNWGGPLGDGDRFTWDSPHFENPNWKALRGAHDV